MSAGMHALAPLSPAQLTNILIDIFTIISTEPCTKTSYTRDTNHRPQHLSKHLHHHMKQQLQPHCNQSGQYVSQSSSWNSGKLIPLSPFESFKLLVVCWFCPRNHSRSTTRIFANLHEVSQSLSTPTGLFHGWYSTSAEASYILCTVSHPHVSTG